MDGYRKSQFIVSPPAVLKVVEMLVLVTGMILFLVENNYRGSFVAMYLLPSSVCVVGTLISYVTAILVLVGGRNPLTTPTWVKGEVWFNVCAMILMLVGSILTLTCEACSSNSLIIGAIALGFISVILFASGGAVTYVLLVRHQEEVKKAQRAQLEPRRVTLSALA